MSNYSINFPYTSSSLTSVTASIASATILSVDHNRGKFLLNLSGSARAYVALNSATATTTAYSFYLDPGDSYVEKDYKGAVTVIFVSASSGTRLAVTDFTK